MSKVLIEIKDKTVVQETRGQYTFYWQVGKMKKADGDVLTLNISLPRGHSGYEPGLYEFAAESFEVDRYKRPQMAQAVFLSPVKAG